MTTTVNDNGVEGEDTNNNKGGGNAPIASSSSCSSEDDLTGNAENSNWKTRAGRGAATDPQSLYARVSVDDHLIASIFATGYLVFSYEMMCN